ncbi:MAG TPA: extracellular solute-binding protein [Caldilineaceae bacterium]|nr:extracellular solute-binding protein [Caldilineaceae bacterium]
MKQQKLSRRELLRITGISATGVLLAACVTPQGAAPATGGEGAAPDAAGTEVRFATDWVEGARGATMDAAMEMFAEQNPDIHVTLEPIGGDYFDRLLIQFSGGTVADAILFEGVLGLEFIKEGLIIDISATLDALGVDQSKWRPGVVHIFKQENKVYAVPFQLTPAIWVYNKTLFEQAGAPLPDDSWDWDMVLEVAQQLTSAPDAYGLWTRVDMFHQYGSAGLSNSDIHWVTEDLTKTNWDEPGFAQAIRWNIESVQLHKVSPPPAEVEGLLTAGISNLFATGKVAMNRVNAGAIGSLKDQVGDRFEWDVMPTPKAPLTGKGGGLWNDQPHVVTSNARDRGVLEEAAQLVVFLAGDDVQSIIARDRGSVPTVQSIQESEAYLSPPPASMPIVLDELAQEVGPFYFPNWLEWYRTANKEFELGLIGERDVDATIEAMVTECNKVLANIEA